MLTAERMVSALTLLAVVTCLMCLVFAAACLVGQPAILRFYRLSMNTTALRMVSLWAQGSAACVQLLVASTVG